MPQPFVDDELWSIVEPLLRKPKRRRKPYPGRRPLDPRKALSGILFVLKSGIPWDMLPKEMGCGSGMSCWRYLHAWQEAGVWDPLCQVLLARLHEAGKIDFSRVVQVGKKIDRTQPIAVRRVRSTTSSRIRKAFR